MITTRARTRLRLCGALLAAIVALVSAGRSAHAGELQADFGVAVRKSTWRGDWSGGTQLGAGFRIARIVAIDFATWEELASVDKRLNTGLTFGVTGALPLPGARPTLRLYFIHQHEEGLVSVADHPFGTVAGIGTGIRHRAGAGTRLGVEIPIAKRQRLEWIVTAGADATWFPDAALGPSLYFGISATIGVNYSLGDAP